MSTVRTPLVARGSDFDPSICYPMKAPRLLPTGWIPEAWRAKAYIMGTDGTCMMPEIEDGELVLMAPDAPIRPGDIVGLHFRDRRQPLIKRLVIPVSDGATTLYGLPAVLVEQLNPPRRYLFSFGAEVVAIHRVWRHFHEDEAPHFGREGAP